MKHLFLLLLALAGSLSELTAQNIILGEKVPELKVAKWVAGQQPRQAQLTYIEFFHAQNPACLTSLKQLKKLSDKLGAKLRVIVITHENGEQLLSPFLSPQISVGVDNSGKTFDAFGVKYAPFGVLTDSRNRALWMGNSLQLTQQIIENSK